jgi:hypothetical protein
LNQPGAFSTGVDVESVAAALDQTFLDNFAPQEQSFRDQSRPSSSSHASERDPDPEAIDTSSSQPRMSSAITDTGVLSLVAHDLISLVADQFGSLGSYHVETGQAQFFLSALANDQTQTMFDECHTANDSTSDVGPLAELGQRQQTQLIDVWYSTHPLSFTVSKTLLLRELRDGTHDDVLLAVILGEASIRVGNQTRGRILLRWAATQLRSRPIRGIQLTQNGTVSADDSAAVFSGISTRIFHDIATTQALVLLGWHALTSSQMRRAICYIGLAGALVTDLKEQISTTADPKASSRINGIDVFEVEKELIDHIYWTTYAICLWAFVQTGNQQFAPPLPAAQPSIFAPSSEDTSVVIRLDKISDNFNTLHTQKAAIRETWPLAHIASVVAYICTFYPAESGILQRQDSQSVPRLTALNDPLPNAGIDMVCHEVTRVLTKSISHFNNQAGDSISRSLVLAAYHTLSIHFLFPAQKEGAMNPDVIDLFCSSAQEILKSIGALDEHPERHFITGGLSQPLLTSMLTLSLDTCSRALGSALQQESKLNDTDEGRLVSLVQSLHTSSKHESLGQFTKLRMVRKQLKAFVRLLGEQETQDPVQSPPYDAAATIFPIRVDSSTSHIGNQNSSSLDKTSSAQPMLVAPSMTLPSPRESVSASASSTPSSEHLSQASTAALDAQALLSTTQDTNKMTSPLLSGPVMPQIQQQPTTMPFNPNSAGLVSPGDVFKPSWQTMGPDGLFEGARMMKHRQISFSQATPVMATTSALAGGPLLQGTSWLPQLSSETMMDIDMVTGAPWGDWSNSNPEASAGGAWT